MVAWWQWPTSVSQSQAGYVVAFFLPSFLPSVLALLAGGYALRASFFTDLWHRFLYSGSGFCARVCLRARPKCTHSTLHLFFQSTPWIQAPKVFRTKSEKLALKVVDNYSLFLSGAMTEPDELLSEQLECLYRAFCFYHGTSRLHLRLRLPPASARACVSVRERGGEEIQIKAHEGKLG